MKTLTEFAVDDLKYKETTARSVQLFYDRVCKGTIENVEGDTQRLEEFINSHIDDMITMKHAMKSINNNVRSMEIVGKWRGWDADMMCFIRSIVVDTQHSSTRESFDGLLLRLLDPYALVGIRNSIVKALVLTPPHKNHWPLFWVNLDHSLFFVAQNHPNLTTHYFLWLKITDCKNCRQHNYTHRTRKRKTSSTP